jgi:hypothetical protein
MSIPSVRSAKASPLHVRTYDPPCLKSGPIDILSKMMLSGRMDKWAMLISQFDIVFIPQKAMKGQALANFLAAHPIPNDFPINDDLPDEEVFATTIGNSSWQMYFDGA